MIFNIRSIKQAEPRINTVVRPKLKLTTRATMPIRRDQIYTILGSFQCVLLYRGDAIGGQHKMRRSPDKENIEDDKFEMGKLGSAARRGFYPKKMQTKNQNFVRIVHGQENSQI